MQLIEILEIHRNSICNTQISGTVIERKSAIQEMCFSKDFPTTVNSSGTTVLSAASNFREISKRLKRYFPQTDEDWDCLCFVYDSHRMSSFSCLVQFGQSDFVTMPLTTLLVQETGESFDSWFTPQPQASGIAWDSLPKL